MGWTCTYDNSRDAYRRVVNTVKLPLKTGVQKSQAQGHKADQLFVVWPNTCVPSTSLLYVT